MSVLSVGDNVLMTLTGFIAGQRFMSTFGYVISEATGTPDELTAFVDIKNQQMAANDLVDKYYLCCPPQVSITEQWWQTIRPVRRMKRSFANVATGGSSGFDTTVPNVASVIERRGAIADRKNISAIHIPAPTGSDWFVDGRIQLAAATALGNFQGYLRQTYVATVGSVKFSPSILNGPLWSDVTPIIATIVQDTSRVMRRRTVGVGK